MVITPEEAEQQLAQQEQVFATARQQIAEAPTRIRQTKSQLLAATPQSQIQVRAAEKQMQAEKVRAAEQLAQQEKAFQAEAARVRGEIAKVSAAQSEQAAYEEARRLYISDAMVNVSALPPRVRYYYENITARPEIAQAELDKQKFQVEPGVLLSPKAAEQIGKLGGQEFVTVEIPQIEIPSTTLFIPPTKYSPEMIKIKSESDPLRRLALEAQYYGGKIWAGGKTKAIDIGTSIKTTMEKDTAGKFFYGVGSEIGAGAAASLISSGKFIKTAATQNPLITISEQVIGLTKLPEVGAMAVKTIVERPAYAIGYGLAEYAQAELLGKFGKGGEIKKVTEGEEALVTTKITKGEGGVFKPSGLDISDAAIKKSLVDIRDIMNRPIKVAKEIKIKKTPEPIEFKPEIIKPGEITGGVFKPSGLDISDVKIKQSLKDISDIMNRPVKVSKDLKIRTISDIGPKVKVVEDTTFKPRIITKPTGGVFKRNPTIDISDKAIRKSLADIRDIMNRPVKVSKNLNVRTIFDSDKVIKPSIKSYREISSDLKKTIRKFPIEPFPKEKIRLVAPTQISDIQKLALQRFKKQIAKQEIKPKVIDYTIERIPKTKEIKVIKFKEPTAKPTEVLDLGVGQLQILKKPKIKQIPTSDLTLGENIFGDLSGGKIKPFELEGRVGSLGALEGRFGNIPSLEPTPTKPIPIIKFKGEKIKTPTIIKPSAKPKPISKFEVKISPLPRTKQSQRELQLQKSIQEIKPLSALKTPPVTKQPQRQPQRQPQIERLRLRQPQITKYPEPTIQKLKASESQDLLKKKVQSLVLAKAYQVLIRRRGKFIPVGKELLPMGRAIKLGVTKTKAGVAQTFKLVPKGTTKAPLSDIAYKVPAGYYTTLRKPQPLTFVERRGKTLTQLPEVRELLAFRKSKSKPVRLF